MKKIGMKEVFQCETFMEAYNAYAMGDVVYYKDENEGRIRNVYADGFDDEPKPTNDEEAKEFIGIYDEDMNYCETIDEVNAKPTDFYVEVAV